MINTQSDIDAAERSEAVQREFGQNGNGVNSSNSFNSYRQHKKPELKPKALHGLAGDIVRAIAPHSEADEVAILTNVLASFGNVVGPVPYARVEATRHYLNLFIAQVGDTSKGRKGQAWSTPKSMLHAVDPEWADNQVTGGLSSGEGVVYAVRDERYQTKPVREDGKIVGNEQVLVDKGADDKRLLLIEEEFAQALKVMSREGNILSPILRQAWDHGNLRSLTKNDPNRATGAHISIIAHITRDELLRYLVETEQTNGFGNRFCWFLVSRSKYIPIPDGVPPDTLSPIVERLNEAVTFARKCGEIRRDKDASDDWCKIYQELSDGKPGLSGAMMARAESQVMRLSAIYALMDNSGVVKRVHQDAGLALWDYSADSVQAIFGQLSGDPLVDTAKEALKSKGSMTLTELHGLFGRNASKTEIERVTAALIKLGSTVETVADRGGRPATVLRWITKQTN